jgi:hypothetical protein
MVYLLVTMECINSSLEVSRSLEVMKLFYSLMVVNYLERNMRIPGASQNKVA